MSELLTDWGPLLIALVILWVGYQNAEAIHAANLDRREDHEKLIHKLEDIESAIERVEGVAELIEREVSPPVDPENPPY